MKKQKKPTYKELERKHRQYVIWLGSGLITALIFFILTGIILGMDNTELQEKLQTCENPTSEEWINCSFVDCSETPAVKLIVNDGYNDYCLDCSYTPNEREWEIKVIK